MRKGTSGSRRGHERVVERYVKIRLEYIMYIHYKSIMKAIIMYNQYTPIKANDDAFACTPLRDCTLDLNPSYCLDLSVCVCVCAVT